MTTEERIAALEAKVAELTAQLAPADAWAEVYQLPANANPIPEPSSTSGTVMYGPLVLEDTNIRNDDVRWTLSHRIEHEWRMGPSSNGMKYIGGNPKAWFRGGVMITANADTPELALMMSSFDEATGEELAFPAPGSPVGRIYESVVHKGNRGGHTMTARTNDIVLRYQGGVDFRVTRNEHLHKPETSAAFTAPDNLNSGRTPWFMGFDDAGPNGGYGTRMIRLVRYDGADSNLKGKYILYIDPKGT